MALAAATSYGGKVVDGSPVVITDDMFLDISRGNRAGMISIHKFGQNLVGTTMEDIWPAGGLYTWPTNAATLEAISTSVNDAAAGTGARTIVIEGLDASFLPITETNTLNGTSASTATSLSFVRVNRAYVLTAGTYASTTILGTQDGDITIRRSGGGATQAQILDGDKHGQTQIARFTVPAGKSAYVNQIDITIEGSKAANVHMWAREGADVVTAPFTAKRAKAEFDSILGQENIQYKIPIKFPEKTDIWFSGEIAAGTAVIEVGFNFVLIDN